MGLALVAPACRAAVWGYIDADGRPHVATEQLDARYELFFKGKTSADRVEMAVEAPAAIEAAIPAEFMRTAIYRRMVDHPNVERYAPLIEANAQASGVDAALVKAMIAVESAFEPAAVSAKGAVGLMQIIPDTGARYGVAADARQTVAQKLLDPALNLRVGTRYLHDLLALFANDISLALAAYNAGEQTVLRYASRIPPYPETQEYVRLVRQFYEIYRPPPPPPQAPLPPPAAGNASRIIVPSARRLP